MPFLRLLSRRREAAARFLGQVQPLLADAARPHIEAAAAHFNDSAAEAKTAFEIRHGSFSDWDRMARIIRDDAASENNPEWAAYWQRADEALASAANRQAMAEHVARVIESEKAAIEEIEKALASTEMVQARGVVRRDGNRVFIAGIERLRFGEGRDNQFVAALSAAMHAIGNDASYDYLMGVSGAAFRLQFWLKEWCPSSPDLLGGFSHDVPAMRALGYSSRLVRCAGASLPEGSAAEQERLRAEVVRSIDAGLPVVGQSLEGKGHFGVIAGYEDGGRVLLCRTYDDPAEAYTPATAWPWTLLFIGDRTKAPTRGANAVRSLQIALELAKTPIYQRGSIPGWDGDQASGFAAFEKWMQRLREDEYSPDMNSKTTGYAADVNGWIYLTLLDARLSAARYLRSVEKEFGAESGRHVAAAASIYDKIVAALKEGQGLAPDPWQLNKGAQWTESMGHAEAEVLDRVLLLGKEAIAEIEQALAAAYPLPGADAPNAGVSSPNDRRLASRKQGEAVMGSRLVKFEVVTFPKARVIGKSVIVKLDVGIDDPTITDLLESMSRDGSFDFLLKLPDRITKNPDRVGWMGDYNPGDKQYTYLAGVLVKPDSPVPDGFVSRDIAQCQMAIGWIQEIDGDEGGDMFATQHDHIAKGMKENGYEYDGSNGFFEMEYYSYERFTLPKERGGKVGLDFYSPCKKASLPK